MKSSGSWAERPGKHPQEKEAPITGDPFIFAIKGNVILREGGAFLSKYHRRLKDI